MPRNSSPWSHPGPLTVLDATSDEDERSEVRPRPPMAKSLTAAGYPAQRGERVAQKIQAVQALLAQLPTTDPRRRLVEVAVLRRDEVLLDGLLVELRRHSPAAPARRRFSSHPRLKAASPGSDPSKE
jgi:hypothetical protein